jgi:glutamyl-tRNA synthetase
MTHIFEYDLIRKHVLKNAIDHQGKANLKSVIAKVFGERPELKKFSKEVIKSTQIILREVNSLSVNEQKIELIELAPKMLVKTKKKQKKKLPELPNTKSGGVVMRLAPNPNGPMHLGTAKMVILNDEYVKKYKGKLILKYDDTDPKNKKPEKKAYELIKKDLKWLDVRYSKVTYASKNIEKYYKIFEKLLKMNKAYICTCKSSDWREKKAKGVACKCRSLSVSENQKRWKDMLNHTYKEGDAVARIKTNMKYKDPAQRDWAAFRIINKPDHPVVGNKYHVWPLMDMGNAVDDHFNKITHILRGMDLAISERRQKWIYKYLGWKYPEAITFGHIKVMGAGTLSKSEIKKGVKQKKYSGWDDPQLGTLAALRRRGIQAKAIRKFILKSGLSGKDSQLDFKKLEAINKSIIDDVANRYFFVKDPIKVFVEEVKTPYTAKIYLHPDHHKKGVKEYTFDKKPLFVFIPKKDIEDLEIDDIIRLKDLFNIEIKDIKKDKIYSEYCSDQRIESAPKKIQWCPEKKIETKILMPDGSISKGFSEPKISNIKLKEIIQFERFGFCRLDKKQKEYLFIFCQS